MLVSRKNMGIMCVWEASQAMLYRKAYHKDHLKDSHKALPTTTTYRRKWWLCECSSKPSCNNCMLQGNKLACLLPICPILCNSRLDNIRYDMVHERKIIPHQTKVMRNVLQEREKARAWTHHNRMAQTNKVHSRLTQILARYHSHNKHKVPIDRSAAKVSMFKELAQTAIVSRSTSKRWTAAWHGTTTTST
jgi:hypothetical protein